MLKSVLVFDIETIPDTESSEPLTGIQSDSIDEQRKALTDYHLKITDGKNPFLRQPFHKIVAISFLHASLTKDGRYEDYKFHELRSGGNANSTERDLVKGFLQLIEKIQPRLVSFNGRTFDLPVIKYRAMVHGISSEYLYRSGDRWNNYMQRYSIDWHCDLLDGLSDYGASARIKMNEVCAAFKLPGKIGVDGSDVTSLYDNDRLEEIRDYCETDVLNTYLIYLRFMYHQGHIERSNYNHALKEVIDHISYEGEKHLEEFYLEWKKVCNGDFFI